MPTKSLYWVTYISPHAGPRSGRKTNVCWSRGYDTEREAGLALKAEIEAGNAVLGFVAHSEGGVWTPLESSVMPAAARKAVRHWLDLCDAIDDHHPE